MLEVILELRYAPYRSSMASKKEQMFNFFSYDEGWADLNKLLDTKIL